MSGPEPRVRGDLADRFESLTGAWRAAVDKEQHATHRQVARWERTLGTLEREHRELVGAGRWLGGPHTLMAALRLQYRELPLTAGLAWLLRPDGHHRLGASALNGLLQHLGMPPCDAPTRVRVALEEQREGTRADLVVYGVTFTIVVEAKAFAPEQRTQLERLEGLWEHEPGVRFVFLTRGERAPTTARVGGAQWRELTWEQVARIAHAATATVSEPAPGVREYIATLEVYHRD